MFGNLFDNTSFKGEFSFSVSLPHSFVNVSQNLVSGSASVITQSKTTRIGVQNNLDFNS